MSVVIPVYRDAGYAIRALESALKQSYQDREVILINDGSPDSRDLERALTPYTGQYKYIAQPNRGPSAARNQGLKAARGRFIAFLDADDYWGVDYLADQMCLLESDPSTDMVYADAMIVGTSSRSGMTFMQASPSEGEPDFRAILTGRCSVITSGVVVKKNPVITAGMFDERFTCSEDYDLWLRLAHQGARIAYQKKVLFFRQELEQGLCANSIRLFRNQLRVLAKVRREFELSEEDRTLVDKQVTKTKALLKLERGRAALRAGRVELAAALVEEANAALNRSKLRLVLFCLRWLPWLVLIADNVRQKKRGYLTDILFGCVLVA